MGQDEAEDLALRDGILRWCDPTLIAAMQQTEAQAAAIGLPPPQPSWFAGATIDATEAWKSARSREAQIRASTVLAWRRLFADLRQRLERGELVVTGVQSRPCRGVDRQELPGPWAADFQFKAEEGAIEFDGQRYVAVRLGPRGSTHPPVQVVPSTAAMDVKQLDDETILRLLHENVERAVRNPNAKLLQPGKISLMPILERKMQDRAETKALLPTLKEESNWLEGWIKEKAPNVHTPTSKTIGNTLAAAYRSLKTRSRPPIS